MSGHGKQGEMLEKAADTIMSCFRVCVSDRCVCVWVCGCVSECSCDSCDHQPDTAGVLKEVGHIGSGKPTHENLLQGA